MKLKVNSVTGFVAVAATKDSGDHLIGDVFGLRPVNAAAAISGGFVKEADHDADAETHFVEVVGDTVTVVAAKKAGGKAAAKDAGAPDGGADAGGGADTQAGGGQ